MKKPYQLRVDIPEGTSDDHCVLGAATFMSNDVIPRLEPGCRVLTFIAIIEKEVSNEEAVVGPLENKATIDGSGSGVIIFP